MIDDHYIVENYLQFDASNELDLKELSNFRKFVEKTLILFSFFWSTFLSMLASYTPKIKIFYAVSYSS